ncbi:GAF domain-containing protein [candidate division WOR-3 bacterium]|nr:GAF domain-containing protein [candidate division WOR-3 bacterium]
MSDEVKTMKYQEQFDEVRDLIRAAQRSEDAQSRAVIFLHKSFPHYNWVGVFRLSGRDLMLGPYQGQAPAGYSTIPEGRGVCGAVAGSMTTEVVPDVGADARYMACFTETRSEIVVPVIKDGRFWGEIAIDSHQPAAFTKDDVEFLEAVARLLAERV